MAGEFEALKALGEVGIELVKLVLQLVEMKGEDHAKRTLRHLVANPAPKLDDDAFDKRLADIEDADEG